MMMGLPTVLYDVVSAATKLEGTETMQGLEYIKAGKHYTYWNLDSSRLLEILRQQNILTRQIFDKRMNY